MSNEQQMRDQLIERMFEAASNRLYELIPPGMLGKGDMAVAIHLRQCIEAAHQSATEQMTLNDDSGVEFCANCSHIGPRPKPPALSCCPERETARLPGPIAEMAKRGFRPVAEQMKPLVEWQPIETAPKDGQRILVWFEPFEGHKQFRDPQDWQGIARWTDHNGGGWVHYLMGIPTFWQPLPAPPQAIAAIEQQTKGDTWFERERDMTSATLEQQEKK